MHILGGVETYQAITTRRSIGKTTPDRPPRAEIEMLLEAAVAAPNHHLTEPWRFIVLTGEALDSFGDAWARGTERQGKGPEGIREKAHRAPVIIVLVGAPKTHLPKVVEVEEHHALGAALQNILLAAHDRGLAAMVRTGPAVDLEEVRRYLGLGENELVVGFVYVGFPPPGYDRKTPKRKSAAEVTEWRGWTT